MERSREMMALHCYKAITPKEGQDYFLHQLKTNYPQTNLDQKQFIVYRWDSLNYDFIYRDQMQVLDSISASHTNTKFDYIFVTEMAEGPSQAFLRYNSDDYKNIKMLYNMDDFISGLHNKGIFKKTKTQAGHSNKEIQNNFKQTFFYLILDSKGEVLYTNQNKCVILKDTAFLNKLNVLSATVPSNILN